MRQKNTKWSPGFDSDINYHIMISLTGQRSIRYDVYSTSDLKRSTIFSLSRPCLNLRSVHTMGLVAGTSPIVCADLNKRKEDFKKTLKKVDPKALVKRRVIVDDS